MLCYVVLCCVVYTRVGPSTNTVGANSSLSYQVLVCLSVARACAYACLHVAWCFKYDSESLPEMEPVLAWEREARDIESGVSTCYVMLMLCYGM